MFSKLENELHIKRLRQKQPRLQLQKTVPARQVLNKLYPRALRKISSCKTAVLGKPCRGAKKGSIPWPTCFSLPPRGRTSSVERFLCWVEGDLTSYHNALRGWPECQGGTHLEKEVFLLPCVSCSRWQHRLLPLFRDLLAETDRDHVPSTSGLLDSLRASADLTSPPDIPPNSPGTHFAHSLS